jgi:hypothetical protein
MAPPVRCGYCAAKIWRRIGRIELGNDADNVRVDNARHRVLVGCGDGALAVVDPVNPDQDRRYQAQRPP